MFSQTSHKCSIAAVLLLVSLLTSTIGSTQEADSDLANLLAILEEETELATKTRMNKDFVPGLLTVLEGRRLRSLGLRTVGDALSLIPGVQAQADRNGSPTALVRGIPFPFNNGSIQILVNSASITRESLGTNSSALLIPLTQVERIEFIRGPGSVVYGDYAFQGLLNVVTSRDDNNLMVTVDDHDALAANVNFSSKLGAFTTNASFGAFDSTDAKLPVGERNADEQRETLFVDAQSEHFQILLNYLNRDVETPFIPRTRPLNVAETNWTLQAGYSTQIGEDLELKFRGTLQDLDADYGVNSFDGDKHELSAEIVWTGWESHSIASGIEWSDSERSSASFSSAPMPGRPPPPPIRIGSGDDREIKSLFIQDAIAINDDLRITVGVRYDNIDIVGSRFTPRLSAVWQPAERHIIKLQYAEGFRTPTFFEAASPQAPPDLDFEINETLELAWIYRNPNTTMRLAFFDSDIDDMVFINFATREFSNVANADSHGVEFDWEHTLNANIRLSGNISWNDSEDNRNRDLVNSDIPSPGNLLADARILWTPRTNMIVGVHGEYVGNSDADVAVDDSYSSVDLSVTWEELLPELDAQISANNVFGSDQIYLLETPVATQVQKYDDRTVWARMTWSW